MSRRPSSLRTALLFLVPLAFLAAPSQAETRRDWDGLALLARTDFDQDFERLVIKFRAGTGVRVRRGQLQIDAGEGPLPGSAAHRDLAAQLSQIATAVRNLGLPLSPLFRQSEEAMASWRRTVAARAGQLPVDLHLYAAVELPGGGRGLPLAALCFQLVHLPAIEVAYPETFSAAIGEDLRRPDDLAPPGITPTLVGQQGYLKPAPHGIDALYAWTVPGGLGSTVTLFDIDTGVNAAHEDAPVLFASDGAGSAAEHGTAVMGIVAAKHNAIGLKGIAPQTAVGMKVATNFGYASLLEDAVMALAVGDVLLLETGKKLAGWSCPCNPSQAGTVAQEYYPAQYDVIASAVLAGITVVETAGNGCVDYDDASFDGWFDRTEQDSGAILVGAGLSASRQPTCYSAFGSRIDLEAWGENVVCLEFVRASEVPVFDGGPNRLYGPNFGGTSSAGAIVAGAVASLQGAAKAAHLGIPLDPLAVRDLLTTTGTVQSADLGHPIGPMPDLRAALEELLSP